MNAGILDDRKTSATTGVAGYYIFMAVDVVFLYVLNNLQYFGISFITGDYISCLWAINLALSCGIIGNFVLLLYRPRWFHYLVRVALDALAILAIYIVFSVFPLSLTDEIFNSITRGILILIMAGFFVGFGVELLKLAISRSPRDHSSIQS